MAVYEKIEWGNSGSSSAKPINAENLNRMDSGIYTSIKKDVGMVAFFCTTTPPDGWLVCDGREVSKSEYSDLNDVMEASNYPFGGSSEGTVFNLPNLQGEFIRGYNGTDEGIDKNRTFGSKQDATIFTTNATGSRYVDGGEDPHSIRESHAGSTAQGNVTAISVRPNNIALLPCIFTGVFTTI